MHSCLLNEEGNTPTERLIFIPEVVVKKQLGKVKSFKVDLNQQPHYDLTKELSFGCLRAQGHFFMDKYLKVLWTISYYFYSSSLFN